MSDDTRFLTEVKRMAQYYTGIPLVEPIAEKGDWVIVYSELSGFANYIACVQGIPLPKRFFLAEVISTPIEIIQKGYQPPEYYQWFNQQPKKTYFTVRMLGEKETQSVAADQIHNITVHR